jgi:hypothetical protein
MQDTTHLLNSGSCGHNVIHDEDALPFKSSTFGELEGPFDIAAPIFMIEPKLRNGIPSTPDAPKQGDVSFGRQRLGEE